MDDTKKHTVILSVCDFIIALFLFWASPLINGVWFTLIASYCWVLIGFATKKLYFWEQILSRRRIAIIVITDIFVFALSYTLFLLLYGGEVRYLLAAFFMLLFILLEVGLYNLYYMFFIKKVNYLDEAVLESHKPQRSISVDDIPRDTQYIVNKLIKIVNKDFPENPTEWRDKYKDIFDGRFCVLVTPEITELEELKEEECKNIFNVSTFNDIRYINQYFIKVNEKLPQGGLFAIGGTTSEIHKDVIMKEYPWLIRKFVYLGDFIWNRFCPKTYLLKKVYFSITKGKHREFPRSEVMGRLYSCGFEIVSEYRVRNRFYLLVRKVKAPIEDKHPSYATLIRLRRVGKGGKMIGVYKFRTMHAYSEYLQPYIYTHNNLREGGKISNDYRVSRIGKFLRKCWLDELPMIINVFKGDLKLVGVRPLSEHYFSLYTPEMQELRKKVKPGLLPPFYVDMPKTIEEVQASEKKYIDLYLKKPHRTDWQYFWKILINIVIKRKRSA